MSMMRLLTFVALASLLAGCITEPAPEEPTVYGHVSKPKKVKPMKLPKPKPVIEELR